MDDDQLQESIAKIRQEWPEFMAGYTRRADMQAQLEQALTDAMRAHPEQRLGQIISNYVIEGEHLFNVTDEAMLNGLRQAAALQTVEQALSAEDAPTCDIRGCSDHATNRVLVEHPMREPFHVDLCGMHLAITSAIAVITISPLANGA